VDDLAEMLTDFASQDTVRGAEAVWRGAHRKAHRRRLARRGVAALTVAVLAVVAVTVVVRHQQASVQSPPTTTTVGVPLPRNVAMALRLEMLDNIHLPAAARVLPSSAGTGSPLGYIPGIGNLVFAARAWTVREQPQVLWQYLKTHIPAGMTLSETGSDHPPLATWNLTYSITRPPTNISDAEVQLGISGTVAGPAIVHAYAIAGWTTPRPANEFVPSNQTTVVLSVEQQTGHKSTVAVGQPVTLHGPRTLGLIREFNGLRILPPHSIYHGCRGNGGRILRVAFAPSSSTAPNIVATLPGCVFVDVTVNGRAAPGLLDGPETTFQHNVAEALGFVPRRPAG